MNDLILFIQIWVTIIGSLYLLALFEQWWLSSETVGKALEFLFGWMDK